MKIVIQRQGELYKIVNFEITRLKQLNPLEIDHNNTNQIQQEIDTRVTAGYPTYRSNMNLLNLK